MPDSRIGIYLLFAAEASLFTAILGAWVVLRFGSDSAPAQAAQKMLLYLAGTLLALHLVIGGVTQLIWKPKLSVFPLFWKITVFLLLSVSGLVAFLMFAPR